MPSDPEDVEFVFNPRQLKRARRLAGFTQQTLAWAIGVHKATVSHYEQGIYAPRPESLKSISRVTRRQVEFFYRWTDEDRNWYERKVAA